MTDIFTSIQDSFNKYIVTPQTNFGINGFVFDAEGETVINLSSEITDHYTEKNSAIQDHVALKPRRVTLKGYVGELTYTPNANTTALKEILTDKLSTLTDYLPELSQSEAQIQEYLSIAEEVINTFETQVTNSLNIWDSVEGYSPAQNNQQRAFLYFKSLWENKVLVSLQTPFEFYEDMIIESVIAKQGEETTSLSDFTIILKEIRVAETLVEATVKNITTTATDTSSQVSTVGSKTALQKENVTNVGNTQGSTNSAWDKVDATSEFWQQSRDPLDPIYTQWRDRKVNVPLD